ncbi:Modification methylase TaqI [Alcanivorax sp. ALC70]|nr:Modification methylase TaqI [Alcanivorax sp. ALC70]
MNIEVRIENEIKASDKLDLYTSFKGHAKSYAAEKTSDQARLSRARSFCREVLEGYWLAACREQNCELKIRAYEGRIPRLSQSAAKLASDTGELIASFPKEDAGYLIGSIYTAMLPGGLRSKMGAYYTPPPLVARLLDLAEEAGFDFRNGTAIDPACGGGAFLAPLAVRMVRSFGAVSPDWIIRKLNNNLKGIEIDGFAAWMTHVLTEASVMAVCIAAKRRLKNIVVTADALEPRDLGQFDLVIGNPPYGKIKLNELRRKHYARSLYGHANLYGLFTDLAVRLVKENGVIAYLTPTSFLAGQYFKSLREVVATETSPVEFDFVSDRNDVFDDVLQETMLSTYRKSRSDQAVRVSLIVPQGLNAAQISRVGEVKIPRDGGPWLLPRSHEDTELLTKASKKKTRLHDLGYTVSTGQLVWNRHRSQLERSLRKNCFPLIWAESVTANGFSFSSERRGHVPYFRLENKQGHLLTECECILVQRTTSKEQRRRIIAGLLPQKFIDQYGGAIVENHLNMIIPKGMFGALVKPQTLTAILNSDLIDKVFRCISGSVAVSAYELRELPFPNQEEILHLEEQMKKSSLSRSQIEHIIEGFYGV